MKTFAFRALGWLAALFALCVPEAGAEAVVDTGWLEGRVVLEGPVPRSWRVSEPGVGTLGSKEKPPTNWNGRPAAEIEVSEGGGVAGVAVWLERIAEPGGDARGSEDAGLTPTFRMEGSCFWPMIAVIRRGSPLRFENHDARSHHVTFLSELQARDFVVEPGASAVVELDRPDRIRLTCNDHAFMRADLIVAAATAWAVTDAEGRFRLRNVPPGDYRVRFGHHRLGESGPEPAVRIEAGRGANVELRALRSSWAY